MRDSSDRSRSQLLLLLLILLATGCGKVDLYSDVPEQEANEMMAILIEHQISCSKQPGEEEGSWKLTVKSAGFSKAVEILSELGRPRQKFVTLQELFPKMGLVSSPAEQRIRLTYGLEQSLAKTISGLPKVVSARVHLVLPNNNPFGKSLQPSSASVVVIHRPDSDVESSIPLIKQIVIGGVAELKVDAVSVELVEAENSILGRRGTRRHAETAPKLTKILFVHVTQDSAKRFLVILVVAAATFVVGLVLSIASFIHRRPRVGRVT